MDTNFTFIEVPADETEMKKNQPESPLHYKCGDCMRIFSSICELEAHIKQTSYECCTCQLWFTEISKLKQHELQCHRKGWEIHDSNPNQPNAKINNFTAHFTKSLLTKERNNISGDDIGGCYVCTKCNLSFSSFQDLQNHAVLHKDDSDASCSFSVGIVDKKQYQCPHCPRRYSNKRTLTTHKRIHDKNKQVKCEVCGKLFAEEREYRRHMQVHTAKRFKCHHCSCSFHNEQDLTLHVETKHEGTSNVDSLPVANVEDEVEIPPKKNASDRTFKCDLCPKRFRTKQQKESHFRTHTGEKPFSCGLCGDSFTWLKQLQRHREKCKNLSGLEKNIGLDNS